MADAPAKPAPDAQPVAVADDQGQVHLIDPAGLSDAVAAGLRPVGRDEALSLEKQNYMQSGVGELATGAAGFLRGLTGGLSDVALDRTGSISGHDLGTLASLNPVASTLGHAGGLIAGLAAPEGEAAGAAAGAGEGLESLGAGAASDAGFGGGKGMLGALAGGAPGAIGGLGKLAEGLVGGGTLGTIARSAVEGAGFQVADNLTEDVFQDKDLTAESLLAHTGPAALLAAGGGLAFEKALGIAKTAIPKTLDAAGDKLDDIKEWDESRAPEAKAKIFSEKLDDLAQTRQDVIEDAVAVKRKLIEQSLDGKNWNFNADQFANDLDSLVKPISEEGAHKNQALLAIEKYRDAASSAKTALDQFDAADELRAKLGAISGFDKDLAVNGAQRMAYAPIQKAFGAVKGLLENQDIWGDAAAVQRDFNERLSPFINDSKKGDFVKSFFQRATDSSDMEDAVQGRVSNDFKALQYLKRESMTTPEGRLRAQAAREALDGAISQTRSLQQFAADRASNIATGGAKVRDVKAAIDALQQAREAGIKAAGPSLGEWASRIGLPLMVRGPLDWVGRLTHQGELISRVAGAASSVTKAISAGARTMLDGTPGEAASDLLAAESPNISRWLDLDGLAAHNSDPSLLANSLAQNSPNLQRHAPTVAIGAHQVAANAVQLMQSLAPKNPVPPSGLPGQPEFKPAAADLEKYRQAASAIERPLSLLDRARDGTLLPLHVDVVAQAYPRLYQQMVEEAQRAITERQDPIPHRQLLMLSTLLRQPIGLAQQELSPMFQAMPSATPDTVGQPQHHPRAKSAGTKKMRMAGMFQTGLASADDLGGK